MTDPIADMIIRIKNASLRKKPFCKVPFSRTKLNISRILQREELIDSFKVRGKGVKKSIEINLIYKENEPGIRDVRRISKPGRRVYGGWKDLSKFGRKGVLLLSTPYGLLTGKEARQRRVGGEILFKINP